MSRLLSDVLQVPDSSSEDDDWATLGAKWRRLEQPVCSSWAPLKLFGACVSAIKNRRFSFASVLPLQFPRFVLCVFSRSLRFRILFCDSRFVFYRSIFAPPFFRFRFLISSSRFVFVFRAEEYHEAAIWSWIVCSLCWLRLSIFYWAIPLEY